MCWLALAYEAHGVRIQHRQSLVLRFGPRMLELGDCAAGCAGLTEAKINRKKQIREDNGWFFGSGANRSRTIAADDGVAPTRDGDRGGLSSDGGGGGAG